MKRDVCSNRITTRGDLFVASEDDGHVNLANSISRIWETSEEGLPLSDSTKIRD